MKPESIRFKREVLAAFLLLLLVSSVAVPLGNSGEQEQYRCQDCNVLIISIDMLRADHVGAYGYERNTTPNIDRLARNSTVFERDFAHSGHTLLSLYSTFTSLYPSQHGVNTVNVGERGYSDDFVMLPEVMKRSGYRTIAVTDGGNVGDGFDRGFESFEDRPELSWDEQYFDRMLDSEQKFFVFLQTFQLHLPYSAPENYSGTFNGTVESFREQSRGRAQRIREKHGYGGPFFDRFQPEYLSKLQNNETLKRHAISEYDGEIRYVDENLGRIFRQLEKHGKMDNTIIIVTSQHGEAFGEKGAWMHNELYNEVINVPLIVYLPEKAQKPRTDTWVENIDIAPTLVEVLELSSDNRLGKRMLDQAEGKSLLPVIEGKNFQKDFIISESEWDYRAYIEPSTGLKYYLRPGTGTEELLFNISEDFNESSPVKDGVMMNKVKNRFEENFLDLKMVNKSELDEQSIYPYFVR